MCYDDIMTSRHRAEVLFACGLNIMHAWWLRDKTSVHALPQGWILLCHQCIFLCRCSLWTQSSLATWASRTSPTRSIASPSRRASNSLWWSLVSISTGAFPSFQAQTLDVCNCFFYLLFLKRLSMSSSLLSNIFLHEFAIHGIVSLSHVYVSLSQPTKFYQECQTFSHWYKSHCCLHVYLHE